MENKLLNDIDKFLKEVESLDIEQKVNRKTREKLESSILELSTKIEGDRLALDIVTHAIEILRAVSDEAVKNAYEFLTQCLNAALERMFVGTTRQIKLKEYTRNNQYPQLEIELHVGNGRVRSLKSDSGRGIGQIVSLLSILSLIVLTNCRRVLVLDEALSGVSSQNRRIITDILHTFTTIGFQFLINEHGFIPKGSKVYHLEMTNDVSKVKETYIEKDGVYLVRDDDFAAEGDYDAWESGVNVVTVDEKLGEIEGVFSNNTVLSI